MTDNNQVDQEKLAEEWAKALAEEGVMDESEQTTDSNTAAKGEEIDQDKLAEEWAKPLLKKRKAI